MMLVTAIITPFARESVRAGLERLDVAGLAVVPEVRVEVVVEDGTVDTVIEAVSGATRTGRVDDATLRVTPICTVVRVRTGARGADAL